MSTICTRCALRLQRAVQSDTRQASKRAFSAATTRRKHRSSDHTSSPRYKSDQETTDGIPVFSETSQPELDDVLTSMRSKHFIPAYLHKSEQRLIFGTKHRQALADNPQTVTIGDDEVQLQWIDRRTEIPNRTKLLHQAINLMVKGDSKDWQNLPALLTGLKGAKGVPGERAMEKIVRKAAAAGRVDIIVQCLQQSDHTGMTLQREEVLQNVVWGLHHLAQMHDWDEEAMQKALKNAKQVSSLIEMEQHGGGSRLQKDDVRKRPEVIGVFLELAAVYAHKFHGGKDVDGSVKMYAERLIGCIEGHTQPQSFAPVSKGRQFEMLHGVPIWHGLHLAQKILGDEMPSAQVANRIARDYEAGLTILAQAIEARAPKAGTYDAQALHAWRRCIRD